MKSKLAPWAALAVVALISTGCGSSEKADAAGSTQTAGREAAMKFANCMRDNGVSAFPDPDASGELTVDGIANNSSVDTSGPAWKKAVAACKNLEPAGFTGTKRSTAQQATALEFAQCIRENGVADFPDPDPNGPLIDTTRIPSAAGKGGRDIPGLTTAMQKCGDVYSGRLGLKK